MLPAIFGLLGPELADDERAFFRESNPAGYILFGRNVVDAAQMRRLTDDLRTLHGRDDLPILIDQEGGRVARMKSPVWPEFPSGAVFAALYDKAPATAIEAARWNAKALARMLHDVGVTVDCLPLLDVRQDGASDVIGDRALGAEPMQVAALGRAILDGLREGGVVGVVKHMPGHGRALLDTHHDLPVVDASADDLESDIEPFRTLNWAPMGMTCHVVFDVWDAERCATLSPVVINDIIRGQIGFDGLLMTDDIDMKALHGSVADNSVAAIAAGCDLVLNCWGKMDDMTAMANRLPPITARGAHRLDAAMATIAGKAATQDLATLMAQRDALLAMA